MTRIGVTRISNDRDDSRLNGVLTPVTPVPVVTHADCGAVPAHATGTIDTVFSAGSIQTSTVVTCISVSMTKRSGDDDYSQQNH